MKYPYIRIYGEFYFKYIIKIFDICVKLLYDIVRDAEVSELADEQDSGSCERYAREGSSPFFRTHPKCFNLKIKKLKKVLTDENHSDIIFFVESLKQQKRKHSMVCGSVGIGRRARLRIL